MEAIDLSCGLFSRDPICLHEEKTEAERMVVDGLTNCYQVGRMYYPPKWHTSLLQVDIFI
uniref:Uncharacterized protein n=1 Tax=Urocitellus parryii TaxID=9999 RepID=A0A8D2IHA1_UROPR